MIIGIPKEIKTRENRVGMVPGGVRMLTGAGHQVLVESTAGEGAGIPDAAFEEAGAQMVSTADEVWRRAEMIVKVKEPIAPEFPRMREGQILYTYLHLAAEPDLTKELVKRRVSGVAYETIELPSGELPLLKPMSEVAGRMSVQVGVQCLEKRNGGKGLLLGGVPGVRRGRVAILGGGVVGLNAAKMAFGLGAQVSILDINASRLAYLDDVFSGRVTTLMSTPENIAQAVIESDLVIGAVLVAGGKAPILVTRGMVEQMDPGSAIVDVAIDQGGSIETIRATTHDDAMYQEYGVNHYGVTNIPGDVPKTSTYALTNVTLRYAVALANLGLEKALESSEPLRLGLNTHDGKVTHRAVAESLDLPFEPYGH